MAQAKITLIGLEKYLNPDNSVFNYMVLPDGIDRQVLAGAILLRCQEFELLWSDPEFMMDAVNIWSRKHYPTFEKWVKALAIEYDPLYNYDRTEEYTDTHNGSYKRDATGSTNGGTTTTNDLTMTNDLTDSNDVTLTHSEKAFNDSSFVDSQKDVTDQDETHKGTVKNTGTTSDNYNGTTADNEQGNDVYTNIHKARLFGNIGVTTSQQMLQSELDIARWNIYEHIADLFCEEFCVMVY